MLHVSLSLFPLGTKKRSGRFDLYACLQDALGSCRMRMLRGDVVVVSAKFAAVSEGRVISGRSVRPSPEAREMAAKYGMLPQTAEVVVRESDHILGGMTGLVLAYCQGMMAPNAGIDASNAGAGNLVLYPAFPRKTAERLRRRIFVDSGVPAGVILADSRLMPGRAGTTGVAVACAGLDPVRDMRGRADLDGRPLKVTFQAVADSIATAANYMMGEGSQSVPLVLVRGSGAATGGAASGKMGVDPSQCIYARSLGRGAALGNRL